MNAEEIQIDYDSTPLNRDGTPYQAPDRRSGIVVRVDTTTHGDFQRLSRGQPTLPARPYRSQTPTLCRIGSALSTSS